MEEKRNLGRKKPRHWEVGGGERAISRPKVEKGKTCSPARKTVVLGRKIGKKGRQHGNYKKKKKGKVESRGDSNPNHRWKKKSKKKKLTKDTSHKGISTSL